jgi:cytochrome c-type biogenesis protein CcsB
MFHLYANFAKAETPFQLMYVAYLLAFAAYLVSLIRKSPAEGKDPVYEIARALFLGAFALNAYTLIERGITAGRPPFKTFYESLIYFGFLFGLLTVFIELLKRVRLMAAISLLIILGALTYALGKQDIEIITVPPALRSGWFLPHVTIYFTGYSSVTVAFVLSILALLKPGDRQFEAGSFWARAMGATEINFEQLHRSWLRLGFLLLASGLITGGLWAKFAWSDYWAWDPKENWGLITWLIYGAVLHMHHTDQFRGRKMLWTSAAAWGFILFTYFGMSYLPTKSQSMHVYTDPPTPEDAKDVKGVNKQMY